MKKGYLALLLLLAFISMQFAEISAHESTHVQINKQFGCESQVTYKSFFSAETRVVTPCELTEAENLELRKLHAQAENYYPYRIFHMFVEVLLLAIFLILL